MEVIWEDKDGNSIQFEFRQEKVGLYLEKTGVEIVFSKDEMKGRGTRTLDHDSLK